jgi:hypothetical protein
VGVTAADGSFSLAVAPDDYTVSVASDGRADLSSGKVTVAGATRLDLAWSAARYAIGGRVVASDGTVMASARVTIRSHAALTALGTLAVGGGQPQPIGGAAALVVTTAQDGTLPALELPAGGYDVLAEPPTGASDGATAASFTVSGAGSWPIMLGRRVALAGKVTDRSGAPVPGVKVTAIEQGAARSLTTVTDGNGAYLLGAGLDPGVPADLFFDPPLYTDPNRHFQRAHLVVAPGIASADVQLQPGLLLGGAVQPPSGAPLAGVRVEAYCGAACPDPTAAAAAATDANGAFTFYLPDPGAM